MGETELVELILEYLPETYEGWAAFACTACAVVSLAVPAPAQDAHWALNAAHKLVLIFGLGAGKLRSAGKLGALARIFRK